MIVLNFSHHLTSDQLAQLQFLTGQSVERVVEIFTRLDNRNAFDSQIADLVDRAGLTSLEWQILSILVVPPALNFAAVLLLAELHGRMGYFPPCIRLRPVEGMTPTQYEVAEVLDLQQQRKAARDRRWRAAQGAFLEVEDEPGIAV